MYRRSCPATAAAFTVCARSLCMAGCALSILLLAGCLRRGQPLIADRSLSSTQPPEPSAVGAATPAVATRYRVHRGDTLYSIAWRYRLDHRYLAALNNIPEPYTIYPGQQLRLRGKLAQRKSPTRQQPPVARVKPRPQTPVPKQQSERKPNPSGGAVSRKPSTNKVPVQAAPAGTWVWPVVSQLAHRQRVASGIDFVLRNKTQTQIAATAAGEVVYAGNGIGGFEHLIIVRHDPRLLSAYSFTGQSRVAEGQQVKAGQQIADIKVTGRTSQTLRFEVRRDGDPIDPRRLLRSTGS